MKVSDLIVKILEAWSFSEAFIVAGGGSMHLNDSFGKSKKIKTIPLHHEQSCAMAADSYFRAKNKPAIINVTTGPGGINALNGVYGAYVDSIPMIVISGQVKTDHLVNNIDKNLRQFGDQEAKITKIAKPLTKKTLLIESKRNILQIINEMIFTSLSGRMGPVWIDVPLDIQAKEVEVSIDDIKLEQKKYANRLKLNSIRAPLTEKNKIALLIREINNSERPLIIVGNGVRFSKNLNTFLRLVKKLKIPVCTVWNSHDILTNDNKYYAGRPGADGERAGNFNMQNADLLIILGARMHVRQVGFDEKSWAREAKKIMIDIDKFELNKPNLNIDLKINMDLTVFFKEFTKLQKKLKLRNQKHAEYMEWCKKNVNELNVFQKHHTESKNQVINPYEFISILFESLSKNTNIITADGTAAVVTFKVAKLIQNQRLYTNKGCASMGYDLPALIGSLYADSKCEREHILIAGDGSIMMNLQELASLKPFVKKNIKIFILNNEGYHSIRQSQANYFEGFEVGCGIESGLYMPNFRKIAKAFDMKYMSVTNKTGVRKALKQNDPSIKIIEVFIDKNQSFEPRVSAKRLTNGKMVSSPLEEMSPLLPKEEFMKRMIINLAKNSNYVK